MFLRVIDRMEAKSGSILTKIFGPAQDPPPIHMVCGEHHQELPPFFRRPLDLFRF